jgi:peptidoglycan L-alanyl-D-glutamate endopeptidase CwlK
MMPSFGTTSRAKLSTCHEDLVQVMEEVVKWIDIAVICGHRGKTAQDEAFFSNKSKLRWPNSKHNSIPSMAVDVALYPIDWSDEHTFSLVAGRVLQVADQMLAAGKIHHKVVWGGDWDRDGWTKDTGFYDSPHFQLEPV